MEGSLQISYDLFLVFLVAFRFGGMNSSMFFLGG